HTTICTILFQSREPLFKAVVCHPDGSFANRTVSFTFVTANADGSVESGRPRPLTDLMRTSSEGRAIPNSSATKHRARLPVKSPVGVGNPPESLQVLFVGSAAPRVMT